MNLIGRKYRSVVTSICMAENPIFSSMFSSKWERSGEGREGRRLEERGVALIECGD